MKVWVPEKNLRSFRTVLCMGTWETEIFHVTDQLGIIWDESFFFPPLQLVPIPPSGWQLTVHGIFLIHELIPEPASEQNLTLGSASRHITLFLYPDQFSQRSRHSRTQIWIQHYDRHRSGWNKLSWGLDPPRLGVELASCSWCGCGIYPHWQSLHPPDWISSIPSLLLVENLQHAHCLPLFCSETPSGWKNEARKSLLN